MSRTWRDRAGNEFETNLAQGLYLDKLCHGLFKKLGCCPRSREDCRLVARVIRNHLHLNEYWNPSWKKTWGIERIAPRDVEWLTEIAEFFEIANGLDLSDSEPGWVDNPPPDEILLPKLKKRISDTPLPRHLASVHKLTEMLEMTRSLNSKEFGFIIGIAYTFDILDYQEVSDAINDMKMNVAEHSVIPNQAVIEIFDDNYRFVALIIPKKREIAIVSKYIKSVVKEMVPPPPKIVIKFRC